jgi:hypothetical protein
MNIEGDVAASPEAQPAQFPPIEVAEDDDEAIYLQDPVAVLSVGPDSPWAGEVAAGTWVDAMKHDPSEDILFNLDAVIKLTEAEHPMATNVALAGIYSLLACKGFGI